jgi:hypothetical protein
MIRLGSLADGGIDSGGSRHPTQPGSQLQAITLTPGLASGSECNRDISTVTRILEIDCKLYVSLHGGYFQQQLPSLDVNSNTGEPLNDNRHWAIATNTICHNAQRPSQILLPIIPNDPSVGSIQNSRFLLVLLFRLLDCFSELLDCGDLR